jgi:3-methyladenine DNA glycosylase AlkD
MTNKELKVLLDTKRRSNGRVYNGDIKSIGKTFIQQNTDVSHLIIGKDVEIDFVYFHVVLSKHKKDFHQQLTDIEPFLNTLDSWYRVDNLITYFKKPIEFDYFYNQSKIYLKSDNPYVNRLGYVGYIKADLKIYENCEKILKLIKNTDEHTLIMAQAWVMAEMYIYQPELIYKYFLDSKLNYPILSMALSKCTDSYRISEEEKDKLRKLRLILKIKKGD